MVRLKTVSEETDPLAVILDLGKDKGKKQLLFESKTAEPNNAIQMELETFAQSIIDNTNTKVSIEDGFKAQDVAQAIIDKMKLSSVLSEDINSLQ